MGEEDLRTAGDLIEEEPAGEPESPETDAEGGEQETETEQLPDETGAEEKPTDDDESEPDPSQPVPYKRFSKVYGEREQLRREKEEVAQKMNLLRTLGPDRYYELYPDERPQGSGGPEPTAQPGATGGELPTMQQCLNMTIQGGPYDGYTLAQLYGSDDLTHRAAAQDIYQNFRDQRVREVSESQAKEAEARTRVETEHNSFVDQRAQEFYGKGAANLTASERGQIQTIVNTLLDRMESGELRTYDLTTAYKLATFDDAIKDAKGKSVKALVESMRKATSATKPDGKPSGTAKASGYDGYMSYTPDQMFKHLDRMTTPERIAFWKKAPDGLKNRFPTASAAYD